MKKQPKAPRRKISILRVRESIAGYVFLLPAAICLLVWTIYPIIKSFWFSLTDFDVLSDPEFIGLQNYKDLLEDQDWLDALVRTFHYVLMFVPALYIISLGAAELIKHLKKGSGFFRTSYYLPMVVSSVAAGAIFRLLLNTRMGLVNKIIVALGGREINFLGSEEVALVSCVILAVWLGFGGNMIIFLAGLQDIPKSYYEAAQIDGARPWQQFVYITFPGLARTSIFVLTMSFINSFQMYDLVKMLTGGGPNYSTTLVVQRIYEEAFKHYNMGYACAMTVALFVIIFIVTMIQLKFTSSLADNGFGEE